MFIAGNFLSRRDVEKLKTTSYFYRQDASKYASGDLKKSILKFDPCHDIWPWHMFKLCNPTENTSNQNLKCVFPLTDAYGIRIQQGHHANPKKCLAPPPPINVQYRAHVHLHMHQVVKKAAGTRRSRVPDIFTEVAKSSASLRSVMIFLHAGVYFYNSNSWSENFRPASHECVFSWVSVRCVTMRQDIISFFVDALISMFRNGLAFSTIWSQFYCNIKNMSQNMILSKALLAASWRNATHRMKKKHSCRLQPGAAGLSGTFNPIVGGEGASEAPIRFSCAIAKQLMIENWNFLSFNGHSSWTFWEKIAQVQLRSPGQVSWPSFKKVRIHAMATVNVGSVWNLQNCLVSSITIKCTSRNFYPGDRRSAQLRGLVIINLGGNLKMLPDPHKPIKTTQFFRDHGHSPYLCRTGCNWRSGVTGRSPEVILGRSQSVFRR